MRRFQRQGRSTRWEAGRATIRDPGQPRASTPTTRLCDDSGRPRATNLTTRPFERGHGLTDDPNYGRPGPSIQWLGPSIESRPGRADGSNSWRLCHPSKEGLTPPMAA